MRFTLALGVAALVLVTTGCRKPKPSLEYTEASGAWSTVVARLGDDAYADDEMTRIEGLLDRVPADSADAAAAAQLKGTIAAERKRVADEAAAHEKAMANVAEVPDFARDPVRQPEPDVADPDAGSGPSIRPGISLGQLKLIAGDCFQNTGPIRLRNPDKSEAEGQIYELTPICNPKFPRYAGRMLVFRNDELLNDFARSDMVKEPAEKPAGPDGGGPVFAPGTPVPGTPSPGQPAQPARVVEPGGDQPPTPLPAPTSPGENTGPAPKN